MRDRALSPCSNRKNSLMLRVFSSNRRDEAKQDGAARRPRTKGARRSVKGFLERLQWRMANAMQGRRGADGFSNFLVVAGIVLLLASILPGLDALSWLAFAAFAYSLFRCYSKNISARQRENEAYERIAQKPKRFFSLAGKAWTNRKTTRYFKCKGCGQVLSVPRGKGELRVVCPKCKTETRKKS